MGFCLLHLAVDVSALPVVHRLLERGAKIPDHDGKFREPFNAIMHSAVSAAASKNSNKDGLEILQILLENGGNPNERLTHPRRYLLDYKPDAYEVSELLLRYSARRLTESSDEILSWRKKI
jgi:ankyrin repeat protein